MIDRTVVLTFGLTLPINSLWSLLAPWPIVLYIAWTSVGSPAFVPVPCVIQMILATIDSNTQVKAVL